MTKHPLAPQVYGEVSKFMDVCTPPTSCPEAQYISNWCRLDGKPPQQFDKTVDIFPRIMPFESDSIPLDQQKQNLKAEMAKHLLSVVFSGGKSIHFHVEVPKHVGLALCKLKASSPEKKKAIMQAIWAKMYWKVASMLFKDVGALDKADASLRRITRNPFGVR